MSITDDSVTPGELPAIEEQEVWVEHLPALITGVKVQGKTDGSGASNFQARVLDARTRFLKKQFAELLVNGVNVLGTLEDEAALEAVPTEDLSKGTAYFVEGALRIWNGTEWASSGSLIGPRGINLIGAWPDETVLPDPSTKQVGDAYIWGSDVWILTPQPDGWQSIGLKGADGKSAYQIAVENGETGTESQWLTKLVGKSAYEIWLSKDNEGTEDDFLASLKGKDGAVGVLKILGTLNSFAELEDLPTEDLIVGSAYFVEGGISAWSGTEWVNSGSLLGPRGITLLGTWPDANALPDPSVNQVGDAYVWKSDIWLLVPTSGENPAEWASIGLEGPEGISAFQVAVNNGFTGTQVEWLASLVGKSAYQTWRDQGNTGTQAQFLASLVGKDAYQMWLTIPENEGKTPEEFFEAFRGHQGLQWKGPWDTGLTFVMGDAVTHLGSSYISTLVGNNTGREPAPGAAGWGVLALKGDKGDPATPFAVMGSKPNIGALPRPGVATEAWYVGSKLYIWVTALGDYADLDGIGGMSAYELAVQDGFEGTLQEWLVSLKGPDAYQVWKTKPGNEDKTIEQFFADIKGKSSYQSWLDQGNSGSEAVFVASLKSTTPGPEGPAKAPFKVMGSKATEGLLPTPGLEDQAWYVGSTLYVWVTDLADYVDLDGIGGLSAYELAKQEGFQGTLQEWLVSLKGASAYQIWVSEGGVGDEAAFLATLKSTTPGPEGPAKAPFKVMGVKASIPALPTPGKEDEAWFVGQDLYVWVETETQYADIGSMGGISAYEVAVAEGFSGTVAEWLASFKSEIPGPRGPAGKNLVVKGTVANAAVLDTISNPSDNDAYVTQDDGHLHSYIGDDTVWVDLGPFKGIDGKSAYQIWLDNDHTGTEVEFLASLKGTDGKDGTSVVIKGSVATFLELPANPEEQWVYAVRDVNILYVWTNNAWISLGTFKGEDGKDGANGTSIDIVKVLTPEDQTIPDATANAGKAYIGLDKHIMLSVGGVWTDGGPVGVEGQRGAQGTGINLRGIVPTASNLPAKATADNGDGYFTANDKMLYVLTDGEWAGPFDITGLQGEEGKEGPEGQPGKSINILGHYDTMALLAAAHPTGALGDGYLVGTGTTPRDLAIWSTEDDGKWINVGLIQGPRGFQGEPGPIGIGKPGPRGPRGSVWITLPVGQDAPSAGFTGENGDWAVSSTFKVYYKTADQGWQYWGQLVAGDVNSPLQSAGKVVRLGNDWVPLLVDEAPNMIDGKAYVRMLIAGSEDNKGEWVELVFPDPFDEPTADGKVYARTRAVGQEKGTWTLLGNFITEAPGDGKLYGRKNPEGATPGSWEEIPASIADITVKDGKLYARSFATDGTTALWKEFTTIADLLAKDGKQYARVYETAGSAPIWKEIVAPTFDRYSVKLLATTGELDLGICQIFSLNASVARTVTFKAGTVPAADRSMAVIIFVNGTGTITWPATITWNQKTQPVQGTTSTVVTLIWDGIGIGSGGRWLGSAGATV